MNSDNVNKVVEELGKRIFDVCTNPDAALGGATTTTIDIGNTEIKSQLTAQEWDTPAFDYLFSMAQQHADNLATAEGLVRAA